MSDVVCPVSVPRVVLQAPGSSKDKCCSRALSNSQTLSSTWLLSNNSQNVNDYQTFYLGYKLQQSWKRNHLLFCFVKNRAESIPVHDCIYKHSFHSKYKQQLALLNSTLQIFILDMLLIYRWRRLSYTHRQVMSLNLAGMTQGFRAGLSVIAWHFVHSVASPVHL